MAYYRGIPQEDIVRSIHDGIALLEKSKLGPATQKYIDGLKAIDPATGVSKLGAIETAASDVQLATALRASGVSYLFARGYDAMQYHALSNTGGRGLETLQALNAWGATGIAMTAEYNKYDAEFDGFMAKHRIRSFFNKAASLINGRAKAINRFDNRPMQRYGVIIEPLTKGEINWTDKSIEPIRNAVEQTLSPFYDTDEVGMTGIGSPQSFRKQFEKGDPMGVIFESTPRAALAVAAALPGYRVLDENGAVIAPPAAKQTAPKP